MVLTLWFLRAKNGNFNPEVVYGQNPNIFSLKVHHGGRFTRFPGRRYDGGMVNFVDMIDSDEFSVHEVNAMIQEIGYPKDEKIFYHFRIPNHDLDFGLKALRNDTDVIYFLQYVSANKVIDVYTEHWETMLHTYYQSPGSRVVIKELAEPGTSSQSTRNSNEINNICRRQLTLEWTENDGLRSDGVEREQGVQSDALVDDVVDAIVDEENIVEEVHVDMDQLDVDEDVENCDFDSLSDEENDPPLKRKLKKLRKKNKKQMKDDVVVPFNVGHAFSNREEIKYLVRKHAVESRRQLYISKNDTSRFRVICHGLKPVFEGTQAQVGDTNEDQECPWILHISNQLKHDTWVVKTFKEKHTCLQTRDVKLCTISYLAREVQPILEVNPTIPLRVLQDQLQKKYQIEITKDKIFRAKEMAREKIEGDYKVQYKLLRDYCEELMRANPNTTVKLDVERETNPSSTTRQFRRIYICLGAMKAGFNICGRDILGLDGCFMKGPYPGQILTAVGIDSNNGIYPYAYAIVESENTDSWCWFLRCLGDDLGLSKDSIFTFISDRQKGVIPAILKIFPSAEHRYCLRHIHENMKQKWRGQLYKNMLWKCASVRTIPQFEKAMADIKAQDPSLFDWLKQIPPKHWARAHFSGRAKSDVLLNNLCEVFNKQLVDARDKPIITCLEYIREYLMKRILVVHKLISKSEGLLTPNATKAFNDIKNEASQYTVIWNGINKYQVNGPWLDQRVVDMGEKTCSCRRWELTGMPCKHVVAVIWNMGVNGIEVGFPESFVSEVYRLETWKKVYQKTVDPVNGRALWTPSRCPSTLLPPKHHKQIGRPKKKRKKAADEKDQGVAKNGKLTRAGNTVTCGICKGRGHNKRSCTERGQHA